MSQLIITTDVTSIRPVFSEGTSENIKRYSQLKKLFETNKEYRFFAEPVLAAGQKIAWHTEHEGKIIPLSKMDEEEQLNAKSILKNNVNRLYKSVLAMIDESDKRKKLFELIDSCIEIPSFDDIYLIQNSSGDRSFCIVRWGFVGEDFNAPKHLIANLIATRVADIKIRAIKGNNKFAANEKINVQINDVVKEFVTDEQGKLFINDAALLSEVSIFQLDENNVKLYETNFVLEKDIDFTFFIGNQSLPKQSVKIQTLDESDNILINMTIQVSYDDVEFTADTNEEGILELGDLFIDTNITCKQIRNNKPIKSETFGVKQGKNIYFVHFSKQTSKGDAKILVIDETGKPIPQAEIQIKYTTGVVQNLVADQEGKIILKDINFKEDVIIRQIIDKSPQFQRITKFSEDNKTFEFRGKMVVPQTSYTKLIISVVGKNDEPIPHLVVNVENGVKGYNAITNEHGIAIIENINCLESKVVNVNHKGRKMQVSGFECQSPETHLTVKFGNNFGLTWLWIILAILAVILAVYFISKIDFSSFNKKTNTNTVVDTVKVEQPKGMKIIVIDTSNNPIENCKIELKYNDSVYTLNTDKKGVAIFEKVADTTKMATLYITTANFMSQMLTIKVVHEKTIKLTNESTEFSEEIIPCGTTVKSQGYHSTIKTFKLLSNKGIIGVTYNMYDIPDKLIVYNGPSSMISTQKIIWQSSTMQKNYHAINVNFNSPDSLITVEIQGGDTVKTEWYFKVWCEKLDLKPVQTNVNQQTNTNTQNTNNPN